MAEIAELESRLKPSGWEHSRFVEKRTTRLNEVFVKRLARAIEGERWYSPASIYEGFRQLLTGSKRRRIAAVGLTGIAAVVEGCASLEGYPYPSGAPRIGSEYGSMMGVDGKMRRVPHRAIDILGYPGEDILAADDGEVLASGWRGDSGNVVILKHGKDVHGNYIVTRYIHNYRNVVEVGQKIKRGQKIAELGSTGSGSMGVNHLHFEVWIASTPGDISDLLPDNWRGEWRHDNPHKYWLDGKITCFNPSINYPHLSKGLTYPLGCGKR